MFASYKLIKDKICTSSKGCLWFCEKFCSLRYDDLFFFSGAINIHPSILPQWKGAAPMSHAILSGALETGVSIVEVSRERSARIFDYPWTYKLNYNPLPLWYRG